MITEDDAFPIEPWQVRETKLELNVLAQSESLFALSNGHIGLRGNLDEGEPYGLPGTYLNSFYEVRPLPYAEAGYGYPEAGQTVVDVTNGKLIRLMVDDEPFDVRYGQLIDHERCLDLRAGTLTRRAHWRSPADKQVKVTSTRLVSLAQRSVAAIEYVVEALDEFVRVTVQSELVANEDQPQTSGDPRVAAILEHPLEPVEHEHTEHRSLLMHRTKASELMMAAVMDHEVDVPGRVEVSTAARAARSGGGRVDRRPLQRMAGAAGRPAQVSRRVLGQRRRRGRGRSGDPAGRALRAVPRAAGQRACRTSRDSRQGSDRQRLRRPHVLGHRGFRSPSAHLHRAVRGGRRAAMARIHHGSGQGAGGRTRPGGGDVSVAHDPRPGVLGLLAGRHGGLARQRRHCDGVRAVPNRHRRRFAGGGVRAEGAGRNRPAVAVTGTP